jgi:hypothetical protein
MAPINKDLVIPKELIPLFKKNLRIIDKHKLSGFFPPDILQFEKLKKLLPELLGQPQIMQKYDLAIEYKGKSIKADFSKLGIEIHESRIVSNIFINGIPVPWTMLRRAGIDHQKIGLYLTPKM